MTKAPAIYDKTMHEARKYWQARLGSMSFAGHVPLDHPRPKDGPVHTASISIDLDDDVNVLLRRIADGNPFLSYATLLLALNVCCYKYSGESAVTILGPATSEAAAANLLPISVALDGSSSFRDALLAIKDALSAAYRYQQYPFSRMLLDMADERRPARLPIIAAMVGFNDRIPRSECDLVVLFDATGARTTATLRFDARVYEETTVRQFFQTCGALLRCGFSNMRVPVADLRPDYAGPSDQPAGGSAFESGGARPDGNDVAALEAGRLDQLIEAQAVRQPQSVAVVDGVRATTYETLKGDAEQLADTLIGLALDVRRPIAILMDASTEMIVSMIAVMKIGAAFAPIKLLSTRGALDEIFEALQSECIICQPVHLAHLQQYRGAPIAHGITVEYSASDGDGVASLDITRQWGEAPTAPRAGERDKRGSEAACVLVDDHDGRVSALPVMHTELAGLFQWLNQRCGINTHDRGMSSPGLGAPEQLYDMLGVLVAGASVDIIDLSCLTDTRRLAERLADRKLTLWDLPTPLMQNVIRDLLAMRATKEGLQGPRNILLSGEKQCASLVQTLKEWFPTAQVTGLYAPSAVGIWSTVFPFDGHPTEPRRGITAQAIPGFEHHVLHSNGAPAPPYTRGELHVRRAFPAAESALAPPPALVNTGLRVECLDRKRMRWLRGEEHKFVKYGCCVELTDVEAVLCGHQSIVAAEVISVKTTPDADGLVAAFVLADPEQMTGEAARDFLLLDAHVDLVPDRFIVVPEFPLSADGAIERDALIARGLTSHASTDDGSLEAEEIHRHLKAIWLEILQADHVNEDESFFARGGNSLKATLLIARIRDEFGVDVSVQNFFRKPSTRAVAQLIAVESKNGASQHAPDFKIVSRDKYRVPLSTMQS